MLQAPAPSTADSEQRALPSKYFFCSDLVTLLPPSSSLRASSVWLVFLPSYPAVHHWLPFTQVKPLHQPLQAPPSGPQVLSGKVVEILSIATSTPQTHTHTYIPHILYPQPLFTHSHAHTLIYYTHPTPVHVFTHNHTHTYIHMHTHSRITHIPQPQHIFTHSHTLTYTHAHICTLIHINISHIYSTPNTCIHIQSHTHTHSHTSHILHPHSMNHTLIYPDLTSWSLSMLPHGTLGFCSQGEKEKSQKEKSNLPLLPPVFIPGLR